MDSGFEDKQNRVLVMTRKGIYEGRSTNVHKIVTISTSFDQQS